MVNFDAIETAIPTIFDHAASLHPEEVVGLVWTDGTVTRLINQARSTTEFSVGVAQLSEALVLVDPNEKTVAAVYHSHPADSTALSHADQKSLKAQWEDDLHTPWVVVTPHNGYSIWEWDPDTATPIEHSKVAAGNA